MTTNDKIIIDLSVQGIDSAKSKLAVVKTEIESIKTELDKIAKSGKSDVFTTGEIDKYNAKLKELTATEKELTNTVINSSKEVTNFAKSQQNLQKATESTTREMSAAFKSVESSLSSMGFVADNAFIKFYNKKFPDWGYETSRQTLIMEESFKAAQSIGSNSFDALGLATSVYGSDVTKVKVAMDAFNQSVANTQGADKVASLTAWFTALGSSIVGNSSKLAQFKGLLGTLSSNVDIIGNSFKENETFINSFNSKLRSIAEKGNDIKLVEEAYQELNSILEKNKNTLNSLNETIKNSGNPDYIKDLNSEYKKSAKELESIKNEMNDISNIGNSLNLEASELQEKLAKLEGTKGIGAFNTEQAKEYQTILEQLSKIDEKRLNLEKRANSGDSSIDSRLKAEIANIKRLEEMQRTAEINSKSFNSSIIGMRQNIDSLQKQFLLLSEAERESEIGKSIINDLNKLIPKLAEAEKAIGTISRATRNARDTGFSPLGNSITQMARELPNFAISARIGIMAISNNLPIMAEEIKKARDAYAQYKEQVAAAIKAGENIDGIKKVPSTLKAIGMELIGFNVLLSIGVTVLTIYGEKWLEMAKSLIFGKNAIDKNRLAIQELLKVTSDYSNSAKSDIERINKLGFEIQKFGDNSKYAKTIVEEFNSVFDTHLKTIDDVKKAYPEMAKSAIDSAIRMAAANKLISKSADLLLEYTNANINLSSFSKQQQKGTEDAFQRILSIYTEKLKAEGKTANEIIDKRNELFEKITSGNAFDNTAFLVNSPIEQLRVELKNDFRLSQQLQKDFDEISTKNGQLILRNLQIKKEVAIETKKVNIAINELLQPPKQKDLGGAGGGSGVSETLQTVKRKLLEDNLEFYSQSIVGYRTYLEKVKNLTASEIEIESQKLKYILINSDLLNAESEKYRKQQLESTKKYNKDILDNEEEKNKELAKITGTNMEAQNKKANIISGYKNNERKITIDYNNQKIDDEKQYFDVVSNYLNEELSIFDRFGLLFSDIKQRDWKSNRFFAERLAKAELTDTVLAREKVKNDIATAQESYNNQKAIADSQIKLVNEQAAAQNKAYDDYNTEFDKQETLRLEKLEKYNNLKKKSTKGLTDSEKRGRETELNSYQNEISNIEKSQGEIINKRNIAKTEAEKAVSERDRIQKELDAAGNKSDADLVKLRENLKSAENAVTAAQNKLKTEQKNLLASYFEDAAKAAEAFNKIARGGIDIINNINENSKIQMEDEIYNNEVSLANKKITQEQKEELDYQAEKRNYDRLSETFEVGKSWQKGSVVATAAGAEMTALANAIKMSAINPLLAWSTFAAETVAIGATAVKSWGDIDRQRLRAPIKKSSSSSASSSTSSAQAIALNPNKTSLTTKEENLNMMQQSVKKQETPIVVKVSEINEVQKKISVSENNSKY